MTTWDTGWSSGITYSNGNLTATSVGATSQSARSTTSKSSGKYFFEVTLATITVDIAVGVGNASETNQPPGQIGASGDPNSLGCYYYTPNQGSIYYNGSVISSGQTTNCTNGDVTSIAVDITNKLLWMTNPKMRADIGGTGWNNSTTANPATGTGGMDISGIAGALFALFNDDTGGAVGTANFGPSGFSITVPSGFSSWDASSATNGPMVIFLD